VKTGRGCQGSGSATSKAHRGRAQYFEPPNHEEEDRARGQDDLPDADDEDAEEDEVAVEGAVAFAGAGAEASSAICLA